MPIANSTILIINIVSVVFLLGLSILLFIARKQIRISILPAVVIILTTAPIYIYNICFIRGWYKLAIAIAPIAYSSGTVFFPTLWLFVHRYFNPFSKFKKIRLIHYLPSVSCFIIYSIYISLFSFSERINFILFKNTFMSNWIEAINIIVIAIQAITYISLIFIYLSQVKKHIGKHFTELQWNESLWISNTIYLLIIAFTTLLICHHSWESVSTWLVNIFDVITMFYFTYYVLKTYYRNPFSQVNKEEEMDNQIEKGIAPEPDKSEKYVQLITEYLKTSQTYLKPTLTITDVSNSTGISSNDISHALNHVHLCNFFDFINKMRIERAVKTLSNDTTHEQNIASITYQSGFSSKEAFRWAFKKNMKKTPEQFMEELGRKDEL